MRCSSIDACARDSPKVSLQHAAARIARAVEHSQGWFFPISSITSYTVEFSLGRTDFVIFKLSHPQRRVDVSQYPLQVVKEGQGDFHAVVHWNHWVSFSGLHNNEVLEV